MFKFFAQFICIKNTSDAIMQQMNIVTVMFMPTSPRLILEIFIL